MFLDARGGARKRPSALHTQSYQLKQGLQGALTRTYTVKYSLLANMDTTLFWILSYIIIMVHKHIHIIHIRYLTRKMLIIDQRASLYHIIPCIIALLLNTITTNYYSYLHKNIDVLLNMYVKYTECHWNLCQVRAFLSFPSRHTIANLQIAT